MNSSDKLAWLGSTKMAPCKCLCILEAILIRNAKVYENLESIPHALSFPIALKDLVYTHQTTRLTQPHLVLSLPSRSSDSLLLSTLPVSLLAFSFRYLPAKYPAINPPT